MIDAQLAVLIALTFVINLIGSLAYSVRIAGVRTRRIALSFSLFNVLVLISRTANTVQAPLLAKRVEHRLGAGVSPPASLSDFRWLLAAASVATIVGALLTPTFQRLLTRAVTSFSASRSFRRVVWRALSPAGLAHMRDAAVLPARANVADALVRTGGVAPAIIITNVVATGIWAVGVFAALYAGYLAPEFRVTASNLSGVINGFATVLLFAVVDPYLAVLTDDIANGHAAEPVFRRAVVWMLGSRLAGTILAQLFLLPAARIVAVIARTI
jgi:hypothetical protein